MKRILGRLLYFALGGLVSFTLTLNSVKDQVDAIRENASNLAMNSFRYGCVTAGSEWSECTEKAKEFSQKIEGIINSIR